MGRFDSFLAEHPPAAPPPAPKPRPLPHHTSSNPVHPVGRRGFAAARGSEWFGSWNPSDTGVNTEVGQALSELRRKSIDLYQNHAMARRMIDELVLARVGDGIRPRAATDDAELNKLVDAKWDIFAEQCCEEGFYAGQVGCVRSAAVSGDGLCRFRRRRPKDGLRIPLALDWMEGHFLSDMKDLMEGSRGGPIIQGKEFDAIGRLIGFWVYPQHPGEALRWGFSPSLDPVFIPASSIAHLFSALRPGQVRGVPELTPVMEAIKALEDFTEAVIHREFLNSAIAAVMHGMSGEEGYKQFLADPKYAGRIVDANGFPCERISDAMFVQLPDGATIEFPQVQPSANYAPFTDAKGREIASGMHVPFFRATGNLTGYNFSAARIDDVPFWAWGRHVRERDINRRLNLPIWRAFGEAAVIVAEIPERAIGPLGYVPVHFSSPRQDDADQLTAIKAWEARIRSGQVAPREAHAAIGQSFDEYIREAKEDFAAIHGAELVLQCDPSRTTMSGSEQPSVAPTQNGA